MLNEIILLQLIILINLCFFIVVINMLTLWYLAGIYLFFSGVYMLLEDSDIFIGFLWVIDLGVGLIFFIFILHFVNFLHQKLIFDTVNKFFFYFFYFFLFFFIFFYSFSTGSIIQSNIITQNTWFTLISWYNYFHIFFFFNITELQLLREIYFFHNSFEFFLINFMLFYGIFSAIILSFLIKKMFLYLNFAQINNSTFLKKINSFFFIRNQNFLKQQNTSTGARVWLKKKYIKNDF